jgi:RNA polymerase sigma-70 factor, ECF subfamily
MERDEVLARLRERLVGYAASRNERGWAEDLAQDVLMVLEQKYAEVQRWEELVPLALQILRYKMAGHRRREARRSGQDVGEVSIADPAPGPEMWAEREELLDRLAKAIPRLGERCREILRMKLLGRSFSEIQDELDAPSIRTVYSWDARCRQKLTELLGGGRKKA